MFRLYDRHLSPGWHEKSSEARIWEGIENVDDGELWETHLSLKSQLLDFVRRRARRTGRAPRRACRDLAGSLPRAQPGRPDHRIRAPLRHLQARQLDSRAISSFSATMVHDPKRPVQFVFAGKAHPLDEPGKRVLQRDRRLDARFQIRR